MPRLNSEHNLLWSLTFADGTPHGLHEEDMRDGLHRAGNSGQDANGLIIQGSVRGKRWSAWYDDHQDVINNVVDNQLHLSGLCLDEKDPTRMNWTLNEVLHPYRDKRIYAQFLTTAAKLWTPAGHIIDPQSPQLFYGPGTHIVATVSFEHMITPGFRASIWGMPGRRSDGGIFPDAYNNDPSTGVETDIFEYDPAMPYTLMCKIIAGPPKKLENGGLDPDTGSTPNGQIDLRNFGIDLTVGFHVIELLRYQYVVEWRVDGVTIQVDHYLIPGTEDYLIVSREANSGVKKIANQPHEIGEILPGRPQDDGLFGRSVIEGCAHLHRDVFILESLHAYAISTHPPEMPVISDHIPMPPKDPDLPTPKDPVTPGQYASIDVRIQRAILTESVRAVQARMTADLDYSIKLNERLDALPSEPPAPPTIDT